MSDLWVVDCGQTTYAEIADLHARAHARCVAGEIPDVLLLGELEAVYTAGLDSPASPEVGDTPVVETRRAGGLTYMGAGVLVGVPLIRVVGAGYVRRLEGALAAALADAGVTASGRAGTAGLWVGSEKIASLGLFIDNGYPREGGFAVHVGVDPAPFAKIDPCGERAAITSLAAQDQPEHTVASFGERVAEHVAAAFDLHAVTKQPHSI